MSLLLLLFRHVNFVVGYKVFEGPCCIHLQGWSALLA